MRVIIIEDKDAKALLDQLELKKFMKSPLRPDVSKEVADEVHRRFHYVVTKWLQDQGCDVISTR